MVKWKVALFKKRKAYLGTLARYKYFHYTYCKNHSTEECQNSVLLNCYSDLEHILAQSQAVNVTVGYNQHQMQFQVCNCGSIQDTAISCSAALMSIAQTWHHAPRKPFPHSITQSKHVRSINLPIQLSPWPCDDNHHHMQGKTSSKCRKGLALEEKHLSKQQQHELQLHHLLQKPWQVTTCCLRVLWGAPRGGLLRRGGLSCRSLSQLSLSLLLCLLKPQSLQAPTDYC